jgi:micrococcal nuclease
MTCGYPSLSLLRASFLVSTFCLLSLGCGQDPTALPENDPSEASDTTDPTDASDSSDAADSADPSGQTIEFAEPVLVKSVVDGDTIEILRNGVEFRVRFKGINTPELFSDGGPEDYAQEAKDFVWAQIGAQEIGLEFDTDCGSTPFDDCYDGYGRLLAYIRIDNGNDLAEELLRNGLARVYRFQNEIYDRMDAYYAAQSVAQDNDLGIWAD